MKKVLQIDETNQNLSASVENVFRKQVPVINISYLK